MAGCMRTILEGTSGTEWHGQSWTGRPDLDTAIVQGLLHPASVQVKCKPKFLRWSHGGGDVSQLSTISKGTSTEI